MGVPVHIETPYEVEVVVEKPVVGFHQVDYRTLYPEINQFLHIQGHDTIGTVPTLDYAAATLGYPAASNTISRMDSFAASNTGALSRMDYPATTSTLSRMNYPT